MENFKKFSEITALDFNNRVSSIKPLKTIIIESDEEFMNKEIPKGFMLAFFWKDSLINLDSSRESLEKQLKECFQNCVTAYKTKDHKVENSEGDFLKELRSHSVFSHLTYGEKLLATCISVDNNIGCSMIAFPWSGGDLGNESIQLEQWKYPDSKSEINGIIVCRKPKLTELEKLALSKIPYNHRNINIGSSTQLFIPTVAMAVAAVAVHVVERAVVAATGINLIDTPHLSRDEIKQLGPLKSAMELINLREKMLN